MIERDTYLQRQVQCARRKATILVALTMLLVSAALLQGAEGPIDEHVDVYLKDLPPTADGFVIVQVSDLHVGAVISRRFMERLVERLNALNAGT